MAILQCCDKLDENRGEIAIRVPSHTIAIIIRKLTKVFRSYMTKAKETA